MLSVLEQVKKRMERQLQKGNLILHTEHQVSVQSLYKSGQVLRVPGFVDSQISSKPTHEDGKVVNPMHRPPLPAGYIPGTHLCQRLS